MRINKEAFRWEINRKIKLWNSEWFSIEKLKEHLRKVNGKSVQVIQEKLRKRENEIKKHNKNKK